MGHVAEHKCSIVAFFSTLLSKNQKAREHANGGLPERLIARLTRQLLLALEHLVTVGVEHQVRAEPTTPKSALCGR